MHLLNKKNILYKYIKMQELLNLLNDKYISTFVSIFLAIYAANLRADIPKKYLEYFEKLWFRILVFFLIGYYSSNGNFSLAVLMAIGLVLGIRHTHHKQIVNMAAQLDKTLTNLDIQIPGVTAPLNKRKVQFNEDK